MRTQELISPQQHWCGLHFRWLYTLRYGTTTPQSLDTTREKGILHKREYDAWQQDREQEWRQAVQLLEELKLLHPLLNYCVYQQSVPAEWREHSDAHMRTIGVIDKALTHLEKLWCRRITF